MLYDPLPTPTGSPLPPLRNSLALDIESLPLSQPFRDILKDCHPLTPLSIQSTVHRDRLWARHSIRTLPPLSTGIHWEDTTDIRARIHTHSLSLGISTDKIRLHLDAGGNNIGPHSLHPYAAIGIPRTGPLGSGRTTLGCLLHWNGLQGMNNHKLSLHSALKIGEDKNRMKILSKINISYAHQLFSLGAYHQSDLTGLTPSQSKLGFSIHPYPLWKAYLEGSFGQLNRYTALSAGLTYQLNNQIGLFALANNTFEQPSSDKILGVDYTPRDDINVKLATYWGQKIALLTHLKVNKRFALQLSAQLPFSKDKIIPQAPTAGLKVIIDL